MKFGNSIDVKCADLAIQYEAYVHKKANDKANGKIDTDYTQEELLNMISKVREKHKGETKTNKKSD